LLVTEPAVVPGPVRPTSASAPLTPEGKVAVRRMAGTDVSGIGTSNSAKVRPAIWRWTVQDTLPPAFSTGRYRAIATITLTRAGKLIARTSRSAPVTVS